MTLMLPGLAELKHATAHTVAGATVGEITERAVMSRAAFYRNYRDKYHLMEKILNEAIEALLGSMGDDDEPSPVER
ncbi:TetR family transcriptional regulator [Nonomuraea angiospora]|uniref:AcrR family transcriptional regulator n=1 Tax=Nonomuraea angiospora TaxID=46172 RepID=A0ABR9MEB9_9ACTN|nr:TetR family transcriptional regulator [Nonomuraea angiospora]MBE1591259.1 AcrR family transcriptional regulator [Nonomuraea angiospora]